MVVFRKVCKVTQSLTLSLRVHKTQSLSVMGYTRSAAVRFAGSDLKQLNFFIRIS